MLSHPTVSLASVVVKDPEYFQSADVTRRVPRLEELRLFTAGSDSGDIVERCLLTGRILVSPDSFWHALCDIYSCPLLANICCPWSSGMGNVSCAHAGSTRGRHQQPPYPLLVHLALLHLPGTIIANHANRSDPRTNEDPLHRLGATDEGTFAKRRTAGDRW